MKYLVFIVLVSMAMRTAAQQNSWMTVRGWFDGDTVVLVPRNLADAYLDKTNQKKPFQYFEEYIRLPLSGDEFQYRIDTTFWCGGLDDVITPQIKNLEIVGDHVEVEFHLLQKNWVSPLIRRKFKIDTWEAYIIILSI